MKRVKHTDYTPSCHLTILLYDTKALFLKIYTASLSSSFEPTNQHNVFFSTSYVLKHDSRIIEDTKEIGKIFALTKYMCNLLGQTGLYLKAIRNNCVFICEAQFIRQQPNIALAPSVSFWYSEIIIWFLTHIATSTFLSYILCSWSWFKRDPWESQSLRLSNITRNLARHGERSCQNPSGRRHYVRSCDKLLRVGSDIPQGHA